MEKMLESGRIDKGDIIFMHYVKAKFFFIQDKYTQALEQITLTLESSIQNGLNHNDLFLTSFYLLRANILNSLNQYNSAYSQAHQLYNMHKITKKEDEQIFGRIFTQLARSELGLGKIDKAFKHITKAIGVFLADEKRNPKADDVLEDPDLAASNTNHLE